MKKSKFTEAQIVFTIKQSETGVRVDEICRKMGISEATFYNWKMYGGIGVSELRELLQLREENAKLKQIVADLSLDRQVLQDVIKKALKPMQCKELWHYLMYQYRISVMRDCRLMMLVPCMYYYQHHRRADLALRSRIREIALTRLRYGYGRI